MSASLFEPVPTGAVARVALPVPVDELFDYSLPPALEVDATPGCRVIVGFGGRHLTGVIAERSDHSAHEGKLRPIQKLIDTEPVVSPAMLRMLREEAARVFCPVGMAIATALPAGSAPRVVRGHALTERGRVALASGAARGETRALLDALAAAPLTATAVRARVRGMRDPTLALQGLERDGLVARCNLERGPTARAARERVVEVAPGLDPEEALEKLARAPRQAALLARIAAREVTPVHELTPDFASRLLQGLTERGFVVVSERAAPRNVLGEPLEADRKVELTPDQADALKPLVDSIERRHPETYLLHGVTGSGKTEVYLRAVGCALAQGRQALVLVPEITLTHQIVARLRGRFGDGLAVLHSGLRPGERLEQWQRLRDGSTPIAVGARSALFAPLENLGVIVIDEEHDGAYKNEEGFRYHAREFAMRRARDAGCPLILGSATPSLETRFAADRGELTRLVLAHRIGKRPLPAVEIVDMVAESEKNPRRKRAIITRPLERALRETLDAGAQSILFLNRRGFSTQVMCFECGNAERCTECDIALVYHSDGQSLRCHYCDYQIPPPDVCSGCGAPDTALLGLGTQRVEEELRAMFPDARVARLDRDTASKRGYTEHTLRALRDGEIDMLIGTQMVAKGHDFPGVRLVGVVAADVGLHMPDFRASERTFQLLTQVAGRAGRDTAPGRVVVQTFVPQHYAVRPVRDHDYETFYEEELSHRASLGFPPFGALVYVLITSEDLAEAEKAGAALAQVVDELELPVKRLGPAPAPLARLRGRHRIQLLVKGDPVEVREAAEALALAVREVPEGVQAHVDAHPIHML
jgi:primosomal protein N' (replication factor Y)